MSSCYCFLADFHPVLLRFFYDPFGRNFCFQIHLLTFTMSASNDNRMVSQHESMPGKENMSGELTPTSRRSKSALRRDRRQRSRGSTPDEKPTKMASPGLLTDAESQKTIHAPGRLGTNTSTDASALKIRLVERNPNESNKHLDPNRMPGERGGVQLTIKNNLKIERAEVKATIKGTGVDAIHFPAVSALHARVFEARYGNTPFGRLRVISLDRAPTCGLILSSGGIVIHWSYHLPMS
ncbi:hypothetical protein DM02DRAFT_727682 [Periconia macrospinosa]|uniref:Uncharacterized protein n=1 Tax=Periconia macrospinosa TaxID=97972 RepID=A0A2V1DTU9_9PLEO|nr:hypothetical protein DM02DRAFT_727682 [Periconia macrospinosa]